MTRTYQEQLDHLNIMAMTLHNYKNKALNRKRKPVEFDKWFRGMQRLLRKADDEEVYTIQIEEENKLPDSPTEDQLFDCYITVLNRSARMLADKKRLLRVDEHQASSEYFLCAGNQEYEISGSEFRVDGEVVKLEPKEMQTMMLVLKNSRRNVRAVDMAAKIWEDSKYVIEAPHIISDLNAKIKRGRDIPNPLGRIGCETLPLGKRASIWHLYLRGEPREDN